MIISIKNSHSWVKTLENGNIIFGILIDRIIGFFKNKLNMPWVVLLEKNWTIISPVNKWMIKVSVDGFKTLKTT